MKLLNDYILVRADDEIDQTDSGLLIASGAVRLPQSGTVEAVADDVEIVKVGDRVTFLRYAAIDGPEPNTRICKERHIVGVENGSERT